MSLLYADTYGKSIVRQGLTLVAEFTSSGDVIRRFDLARTPPDFDLDTELAAIELGFEPPEWYRSFEWSLRSPVVLVWEAFSERPLEFTQFLVAVAKMVGKRTAAFSFYQHDEQFSALASQVLEVAERLSELGAVPEDQDADVLEMMLDDMQEHERDALVEEARELRRDIRAFYRSTVASASGICRPLTYVSRILELATDTLEVDWYDEDGEFDASGVGPYYGTLTTRVEAAFDAYPGMTNRRHDELMSYTRNWMLGETVRLIEQQQAELA